MQNYPTKANVKLSISATVLLHMWLLIIDTKSGALSCVCVCVWARERFGGRWQIKANDIAITCASLYILLGSCESYMCWGFEIIVSEVLNPSNIYTLATYVRIFHKKQTSPNRDEDTEIKHIASIKYDFVWRWFVSFLKMNFGVLIDNENDLVTWCCYATCFTR